MDETPSLSHGHNPLNLTSTFPHRPSLTYSIHHPQTRKTVPNLDLPALCSPKFKPGPPTDESQVLSDRLNEALVTYVCLPSYIHLAYGLHICPGLSLPTQRTTTFFFPTTPPNQTPNPALQNTLKHNNSANTLPLESLCIQPNKSVWTIYLDAICINYDGNAFDAALMAMVLALKNDPTSFEEPLLNDTLTIIMDDKAEFISVSHLGVGSTKHEDALSYCMEQAKERHAAVFKTIYSS
ncbi:hypothetical protein CC1G_12434 [Coprinopsis cinerea okayama7|uniref:Ribosomal RNA-processing protein 43 n=1 Tax=Coprinopsis cinerea (strain Okayama-7 / 130 / ATCC MYA-4618 / FGSC 9003) TaxID=240176 RepID=A8P6I1_COPC7|nr:hypothetical protein CC1G_12434 [Coprinopsis cinerea okayama7\|eukprot:XP_001839162.1 hypothetical protein CC1G_12434 [Coprinopsis cinerea okayama7\